jgi:hypothetical protein
MFIGLIDVSTFISANVAVERAARAGTEYALMNDYTSAGVSGAVTAATTRRTSYMSAIAATPGPAKWCACPNATTGLATATCGTTCTSGLPAGSYVTSSAQATYTPLFAWPGLSGDKTINSSSTVRIE